MLSDFGLANLYSLISKMWLVAAGPEEAGQSRDTHGDESHLSPTVEAPKRAPQLVRATLDQEIFSPNSCRS
mgnify:CR=1 FL=1